MIAALDRLIEPYGGRGALPRSLQLSAWTLENELSQLQTFGFITPLIFFGVAAFILNVALARALALQRPQIAALKALGYTNRELAWHYIKWGLVIAGIGAAAGVGAGAWLGSGLTGLYNQFFRFPALDYELSASVAVASLVVSLVVAALGAQSAVRRAVRIPPAEAMRPELPAGYRRSLLERPWRRFRMTLVTRMILRNLERQPGRTFVSVLGIAFAVAVLFVGLAFIDVMDELIDQQFSRGDAAGCDGELRRAAVGARHARGRAPAGRHGHRADAQRAGPPSRRPPVPHAGDHRPAADAGAESRRRSGRARAVAAGGRPGPVQDAGRHPRRRAGPVAAGRSARRRCSRCATCRWWRWSTTRWGFRPTCRSTPSAA